MLQNEIKNIEIKVSCKIQTHEFISFRCESVVSENFIYYICFSLEFHEGSTMNET